MRARLLAISAAIHGLAAGLVVLVGVAGHGGRGEPGAAREILVELVPARPAGPPAVIAPIALAATAPIPAPRAPRRSGRPAPARPIVTPPAAAPAAGDVRDAPRPGDAPPRASEDPTTAGAGAGAAADAGGSGAGASGDGNGDGNGGGGGRPAIDLSKRPVPINAATSHVLPYTADALRKRITGDVRLVLHVDAQGAVVRTTFRQRLGHGLDEIAAEAARKIRFHPARDPLGRPTEGNVSWRFHFTPP